VGACTALQQLCQEDTMHKFSIKPPFPNKGKNINTTFSQMAETIAAPNSSTTVSFAVHGMWSSTCVQNIQEILAKQPGVSLVYVDYAGERVCISFDPRQNTVEHLKKVIDEIGYTIRFINS